MTRIVSLRGLFALALLCLLSGRGASQPIQIDFFSVNEGLSQSSVNCLFKDSFGFIWIGTQDGLNRFDGYEFKVFRNIPFDSLSIANNDILSIAEDKQGNLWIGTWNGLSHYNRREGTFTNYFHNPGNEQTLSDNRIYVVYIDRVGVVWLKTATSLDRFDSASNSFVRFPHFNDFLNTAIYNNDLAIYEDSSLRLWVGTKDGLLLFDRSIEHFKRYAHEAFNATSITGNRIKHIYEDSQKNIWVATDNGLNRYRPGKDDFERFTMGGRMAVPINFLFESSQKKFLVGTNEGLHHFNPSSGAFTPAVTFMVSGEPMHPYQFNDITEDASKILWVGTSGGLVKWDLKEPKFKLIARDDKNNNLFASNSIASIYASGNDLWVGTWGSGLFRYNQKTRQKLHFAAGTPKPIANNTVHSILKTSVGGLVIGVDGGVQVFDERTSGFRDFFTKQRHAKVMANVRVYKIREDRSGALWFATSRGLHRFLNDSLTSYLHAPGNPNSMTSNEVLSLAIEDSGNIWAGTYHGLNYIEVPSGKITTFRKPKRNTSNSLLSSEIISLLFSPRTGLWVGTTNGLHRYDASSGSFTPFTEHNGLPNNLIYSMQEDNQGRIWMSTNRGLAVLNPSTGRVEAFSMSDGLQGYEYNLGASFKSKTGELFFGGLSGLNVFHPDSIRASSPPPALAFTNIEIIGHKQRKSRSIEAVEEIEVPGSFSFINIEFAALDFTQPGRNNYKYQMVGLDDGWVDLGTKRSVSFPRLNEGVYILRVKGSNSERVWNENAIELRIIVRLNIFSSRIAKIFYILIVVASVSLIVFFRYRDLLKTKKLLNERSRAIIDSERQKEELVVKNKSITDSINYAKRIQEAILPSEAHFKKILPDSFILYMPKDIVSGDFYWVNETNNKIFVASVDCTGHGVPGAFMSIIGVELLRNITNVQGINDAAEILNRLHKGINDTFAKGIDDNVDVKDGMDVSFCVIDKENNQVQFAGAFTSLYIVRNSKIIEIKGDRLSVGMGEADANAQFTSHFFTVEPDDMLYIFTDGYIDQFGGAEGKKFKFRRFRHLLLSIHKLPFEEQRRQLQESIIDWMGEHEQVDDILIIGIKPDLSCLF